MKAEQESAFAYFHPKNWIIILVLALTRTLVLLPYPFIVKIGELLGHALYRIPSSRSQVALRNIQLCFPNLSPKEQLNLLRKHFISLGIGFIEVGIARWKSTKKLKQIVQVQGLENLRDAVAKNKGVILLSAHFTLLEISALIGRNDIGMGLPPLVGMFRLGNNPLINRFFRNTRLRSCESLVTKNEVKDLIRALKNKKIVWYAADQSFIGKNAIPVKFFGHEAMGTSAIPVFAMPRFKLFLETNGPWSQLVELNNIELMPLENQREQRLGTITVIPFTVPHRDEYSETVGYRISGPNKSAIFIPDINKWSIWDTDITELIKEVDYALLDATFYKDGELGNRDMSQIPHPFVTESMALFGNFTPEQRDKVWFIHFNHTNPLLNRESEQAQFVRSEGFNVAREGIRLPL